MLKYDDKIKKIRLFFISLSISTNVWDRVGIELATPVARHVTNCATRPGIVYCLFSVSLPDIVKCWSVIYDCGHINLLQASRCIYS